MTGSPNPLPVLGTTAAPVGLLPDTLHRIVINTRTGDLINKAGGIQGAATTKKITTAIAYALHQLLWILKNLEVDMWWHAPNIAWPLRKDDMNMPLQNGSRARRKSLA